jgi:uncharacterized membrane protein YjjP (DUF1212 family)
MPPEEMGADVESSFAHQSDAKVTQAVTAALDLAAVVLQNGGSALMADTTLKNVLKGFGEAGVATVYRQDFIAASSFANGQAWTVLRPLSPAGLHLVRASEAATLSERVARGEVDTVDFESQLGRIKQLASPYNRWTTTLAAACAAAAFSRSTGGDWRGMGVVLVAAAVGQLVRALLQKRNFSRYAVTFICALISGFLAVAGLRLGLTAVAGATLIGSVVYMVPGVPLINGFVEIASGKHLFVGLQRLLDATSLFFILTVAVAIANSALRTR